MIIKEIKIVKVKKSYMWKAIGEDGKTMFHSLFKSYTQTLDEATDIACQLKDDDNAVDLVYSDDKVVSLILIPWFYIKLY